MINWFKRLYRAYRSRILNIARNIPEIKKELEEADSARKRAESLEDYLAVEKKQNTILNSGLESARTERDKAKERYSELNQQHILFIQQHIHLESQYDDLTARAKTAEEQIKQEERLRNSLVREELNKYVSRAQELIPKLHRAYQEVVAGILIGGYKMPGREMINLLGVNRAILRQNIKQERRASELSEVIERLSSGIVQYASELLRETNRDFARAPIMVLSEKSSAEYPLYMSTSFKEVCKMSCYDVKEITAGTEVNKKLTSGETYTLSSNEWNITFIPYTLNNGKLAATLVYAIPKIDGQEDRTFRNLAESAVSILKKHWHVFNRRLPKLPAT